MSFFIRMLKNKAQIARESIKTTLEFPGPLSGPWTLPKVSSVPRLYALVYLRAGT